MTQQAAQRFGALHAFGDWREILQTPNINVIDITWPNHLHHQMALAAIKAGKYVYCEKPLAVTEPEAREMAEAAQRAGVIESSRIAAGRINVKVLEIHDLVQGICRDNDCYTNFTFGWENQRRWINVRRG